MDLVAIRNRSRSNITTTILFSKRPPSHQTHAFEKWPNSLLVFAQAWADPRHPLIIARKLHSAGRGPSDNTTTTPPSSSIPSSATLPLAIPFLNTAVHLPPAPISAVSLNAAQNALSNSTASSSGSVAPVPLGLPVTQLPTTLSAVPDVSNALAANTMLAIPNIPPSTADGGFIADTSAVAAPQSRLPTPTDTMIDSQSIQAQVEALITSTSSSVIANSASTQNAATQNVPLTAFPTVPTTGALPILAGAQTEAPIASVGTAAAATAQAQSIPQPQEMTGAVPATKTTTTTTAPSNLATSVEASLVTGPSFQNTFAQYQFPQNCDRAFKEAARATSEETTRLGSATPASSTALHAPANNAIVATVSKQEAKAASMTREEEEKAADALIAELDAQEASAQASQTVAQTEPLSGSDLVAAVKAIGLEADADFLGTSGGMSEDQRALAAAIQRLGDAHGEEAEKAIQQAAAAAAAAAAARASQELARAAAKEQGNAGSSLASSSRSVGGSSTPASAASRATSRSGSGPVKRFPCPKCDKAFARAYNLNTHLSTHDPDPNRSKPFACPYPSCKSEGGRSFSRKHDLQRHVASIHENEAEPGIHGDPEEVVNGDTGGLVSLGLGTPGKKFRCHGCGRSFVRRDACNRHQCDGKDSPSNRTSTSPSGTPFASSVSPRPNTAHGINGGSPVILPPVRSTGAAPMYMAAASSYARGSTSGSSSPVGSNASKQPSGSRSSSSLSKEVQAVAKQLQARVEAQSPGLQVHGTQQRPMALLPGGERRNFPLSAISLYASTGSSGLHSSSSSSSGGSKAQIAK
ncbi:hypothetical protein NDA11_007140 [Ustilago hordei]|nr:hypothetical protein NDA10_000031 [Ustilago hordei]KAJ1573668.1 hypothetical protein NDA15_001293 [Ustilago hordei]KAJ1579458.1 hypothetical protein NDA11_007140 [Ustilago hordei]KAJ1579816.1 hypothetical protein NDA12_007833 [Ustilago hordei]